MSGLAPTPPPALSPPKASLVLNMLANSAAQGWNAALSLLVIPVYLRVLGVEAYGLVGILAALQGILRFLDFGLTPAITRQMAFYKASPDKSGHQPTFVRTFEIIFIAIGLVVAIVLGSFSVPIAKHWLNPSGIDDATVWRCLALMAVICGLQWPISFYSGCLMGMERQVQCNAFKLLELSGTYLGGLLLLRMFPRIETLLAAQMTSNALSLLLLARTVHRLVPASGMPARFSMSQVLVVRSFAAGMFWVCLGSLVVTQLDKVMISRWLPLETFGFYALAVLISTGVASMTVLPLFAAMFPRLSAIAIGQDKDRLVGAYHFSSQLVTALIVPACAILICYAHPMLMLWIKNAAVVDQVSPVVSVILVGTALNGLMHVPYALQLALGRTDIPLRCNLVSAAVAVPLYWLAIPRLGTVGAAAAWSLVMLCYAVVSVVLTRPVLRGQTTKWIFQDTLIPALAAVLAIGLIYLGVGRAMHGLAAMATAVGSGLIGLAVAALSGAELRMEIAQRWRGWRRGGRVPEEWRRSTPRRSSRRAR